MLASKAVVPTLVTVKTKFVVPASVSACVTLSMVKVGAASSFVIVSVVGFGGVIVAVSVGFDKVMLTVSSASCLVSPLIGISKVLLPDSPAFQCRLPATAA